MAVNDTAPTKAQLEHRILWRDTLRTSAYKQGKGALKQDDLKGDGCLHCCLGVAEELRGCTWKDDRDTWRVVNEKGHIVAEVVLSRDGVEWLGFQFAAHGYAYQGKIDFGYEDRFGTKYVTLAELNDGDRVHGKAIPPLAFDQIADVIDYFLIRPFVPGGDRAHEVRP